MSRKWIDRGFRFVIVAVFLLFPLGISFGVAAQAQPGQILVALALLSVLSAAGVGVVLIIIGLVLPRSHKTEPEPPGK